MTFLTILRSRADLATKAPARSFHSAEADPLYGRAADELHGLVACDDGGQAGPMASWGTLTTPTKRKHHIAIRRSEQTYTCIPTRCSCVMFDAAGHPVTTGRLITDRDLEADGKPGTADDTDRGGMHLEGRRPRRATCPDQPDDADVGIWRWSPPTLTATPPPARTAFLRSSRKASMVLLYLDDVLVEATCLPVDLANAVAPVTSSRLISRTTRRRSSCRAC